MGGAATTRSVAGGTYAGGRNAQRGGTHSSGRQSTPRSTAGRDMPTVRTGAASATSAIDCAEQGVPIVIAGTLTNSSSHSGRVYVKLRFPDGSTSMAGASYLVRAGTTQPFEFRTGVTNTGPYVVESVLDVTGTAVPSQVDPVATAPITLMGTNVAGVHLTLTDPMVAAPGAPSIGIASATSDGVVVLIGRVTDAHRIDQAEFYRVYYTGDLAGGEPGPMHHDGVLTYPLTTTAAYLSGFTNGQEYAFAASAVAAGVEGPVSVTKTVTVGTASSGNRVSGTIALAGIPLTPSSKLLNVLYSPTAGTYASASGASTGSFALSGVATGTYRHMAFVNLNGDGIFSNTEPHVSYDTAGLLTVNANVNDANLTLPPTAVVASVTTSYLSNAGSYDLDFEVSPNTAMPTRVTLCAGPHVTTPADLGIRADGVLSYGTSVSLPSGVVPSVGDSYKFNVQFDDGSISIFEARIGAVWSGSIALESPAGDVASNTPTFVWSTTGALPTTYAQIIWVHSETEAIWELDQIDPSTRSIAYNSNRIAALPWLQSNTIYNWSIRIRDNQGNTIDADSVSFTPVQ